MPHYIVPMTIWITASTPEEAATLVGDFASRHLDAMLRDPHLAQREVNIFTAAPDRVRTR